MVKASPFRRTNYGLEELGGSPSGAFACRRTGGFDPEVRFEFPSAKLESLFAARGTSVGLRAVTTGRCEGRFAIRGRS